MNMQSTQDNTNSLLQAGSGGQPEPEETASNSVKALDIILDNALLGHTADKKAYACLTNGTVTPLESKEMKAFLMYHFHQDYNQTLSNSAMNEAIGTACAIACKDGPEWKIGIRSAREGNLLEIDFYEGGEHRVRIEPDSASIIPSSESNFLFKRPAGALPLALPSDMSDPQSALSELDRLKRHINLEDSANYPLLLAAILYSISGVRGFPIMAMVGAAGSGKSEAARVIRSLIDPNTTPLGSISGSDREAFIEASNIRLITLDNIQPVRDIKISDRLAKISTGGGVKPRALYTDGETNAMFVCNPILTTSIEVPARRSDLADRMLTFHLVRVPEDERLTVTALEERFKEDYPRILAGLYVLISKVMAELETMDTEQLQLPRLADFGRFGIAMGRVLGLPEGEFMRLYRNAVRESSQGVVEDDPLLQAVLELMGGLEENTLQLTPKALSTKLTLRDPNNAKLFNSRSLGKNIRKMAEDLEKHGIVCTCGRGAERYIRLTKKTETS